MKTRDMKIWGLFLLVIFTMLATIFAKVFLVHYYVTAVIILGIIGSLCIYFFDEIKRESTRKKIACLFGISIIAGAIAVLANVFVNAAEYLDKQYFDKEVSKFKEDPEGFKFLKNYAKENYQVDMVLANSRSLGEISGLNLPTGMLAANFINNGYCELQIAPDNVRRVFNAGDNIDQVLWGKGIVIHELGHCLDLRRDLPAFGKSGIHSFSIAPKYSESVRDIDSYIEATQKQETVLWREAFSDIFAVGFWKLNAPQQAEAMSARLIFLREKNLKSDKVHGTTCWIKEALHTPGPNSQEGLFDWADEVRKRSSCEVKA